MPADAERHRRSAGAPPHPHACRALYLVFALQLWRRRAATSPARVRSTAECDGGSCCTIRWHTWSAVCAVVALQPFLLAGAFSIFSTFQRASRAATGRLPGLWRRVPELWHRGCGGAARRADAAALRESRRRPATRCADATRPLGTRAGRSEGAACLPAGAWRVAAHPARRLGPPSG